MEGEGRDRYATAEETGEAVDEENPELDVDLSFPEHAEAIEALDEPLKGHVLYLQAEVARLSRANRGLQMQRVGRRMMPGFRATDHNEVASLPRRVQP